MRKLILFLFVFVTGCTVLCPPQPQVSCREQDAFGDAFDSSRTTRSVTALKNFRNSYPDSIWADRAGAIITTAGKQQQYREKLANLQKEIDQQEKQIGQLKESNQQLTQQLEQLKRLLIELEKHSQ